MPTLALLDSKVVIKFNSIKIQPGQSFSSPRHSESKRLYGALAKGTPFNVAANLLEYMGCGTNIDFFSKMGISDEVKLGPS
jgi:hypothetical protein